MDRVKWTDGGDKSWSFQLLHHWCGPQEGGGWGEMVKEWRGGNSTFHFLTPISN